MIELSLNLVDYTFQRRIKPIQNLSLIVAGILWIFILPLLLLNNQNLSAIASYLILFSIVPFSLFLVMSIPFFFKKKIGEVIIDRDKIKLNDRSYNLNHIRFELNIDQATWMDTTKSITKKIKSLPKWGNYIFISDKNIQLEFEPSESLEEIVKYSCVGGYEKRPALLFKTSDILNSLLSILWAAS